MKKINFIKLFIFLSLNYLFFHWFFCTPCQAVEIHEGNPEKILLVYDSLNVANGKEKDIDALQRLLTSFGVEVQSMLVDEYRAKELLNGGYSGLITMINWPDKPLKNADFLADRKVFSKKKLHIGLNMTKEEKQTFTANFHALSHRQFMLKDNQHYYQQLLDFQDQSLVAEGGEGQQFGKLVTQELTTKEYDFGLIENQQGFLPMFSHKGAIFLQSAELIGNWLGKSTPKFPILSIEGFNPMKDMQLAQQFRKQLTKLSFPYILSSTNVNLNNTLHPYKVFTNVLAAFESAGNVFLATPVVNDVKSVDNQLLTQEIEQQMSLLIERNIYPVGLTIPGYWNQDEYYQNSALSIANTIILTGSSTDEIIYQKKSNHSLTFQTAFFSLPYSDLAGIEWKKNGKQSDYKFPMSTVLSFPFPDTKKQINQVIHQIKVAPIIFTRLSNNRLELQTLTQHIEFKNNRLYLNDKLVNQLDDIEEIKVKKMNTNGHFVRFFSITNFVLIATIIITLLVLSILFLIGRRNYRSKFIRERREIKK
nr:hypothetical protein [Melissococcus plutonius]